MKIKTFILFSILTIPDLFGQTNRDTTTIRSTIELGHTNKFENPDSAIFYYQAAYLLAQNIIKNSTLSSQQKSSIQLLKANSLRYTGIAYNNKGNFEQAIGFFSKAVDEYNLIDITDEKIHLELHTGITACYNNMGISYATQGNYEPAIEYFTKSLKIFEELSKSSTDTMQIAGKYGMAASYNRLGIVYWNLGEYDNSYVYYSKSLEIAKELDDKEGILTSYNNIGGLFSDKGDYARAIEAHLSALKIAEEGQYKEGIFNCYNNIGLIHNDQKDYNQAMAYFEKSLEVVKELNDKTKISLCYGNIGLVYHNQGKYKNAIEYYLKSLKIEEELQNIKRIAEQYNNLGIVYQDIGEFNKAIEYYTKTMKIDKESGDKNGTATSYGNLALLNLLIADSIKQNENLKLKYLNKAIEYGKQSLEIAQEIQAYPRINETAETLKQVYKKLGQPEMAFQYAEIFISSKDSMFSQEKTSAIANAEKKFESEKKQLLIEKLNKEKELQQSELLRQQETTSRQRLAIFSVVAGLILIVVFTIFIINRLRITRKQKRIIEEQNKIVEEKNSILNQQKNEIEQSHLEISQSIDYAKRIQSSILPDEEKLTKYVSDHFVLFKPKDKVSGDFYWWDNLENHTIITAADCTGHGVPGAFMSMLGVSFLREIVTKEGNTNPGVILRKLRSEVIRSLKQKGDGGGQKDGMDLALISICHSTNVVQFAGANNPLYIITDSDVVIQIPDSEVKHSVIETIDKQLIEFKPNKMPIGIYQKMDKFTCHEINIKKGDTLYMFSDGYEDQFGGENGKKFMSKSFKKLLLEIADKPMNQQKEILETTIEAWKGCHEQIDDILVVGVKI